MARRLTVTAVNTIRSGVGNKGPWTLYGIEATDEQGNQIPEQLKSFSQLPLGRVEVDVERQEHEQYGVSYLLKPVKASGGNAAAGGQQLNQLADRVTRLESRVTALEGGSPSAPGGQAAGLPDDDIPF